MSCIIISITALDRITPVTPPKVNIKRKPYVQDNTGFHFIYVSVRVSSHVNTLIPVGIAITIVAAVK